MYRTTLLFVGVLVSIAATGCKSDLEKYADDVCACKDEKCFKEVEEKYKDKLGDKTKLKNIDELPAKDKEAIGKALKCVLEQAAKK
ncbi:MAG: hypothetical protein HOW73_41310 [Polyangiaceae bacterium]|nr:hypothetical protein [Polyangiaceae bacterium]